MRQGLRASLPFLQGMVLMLYVICFFLPLFYSFFEELQQASERMQKFRQVNGGIQGSARGMFCLDPELGSDRIVVFGACKLAGPS